MKKNLLSGFTLIELIVVMAILAILALAAFTAINPGQRTADARNATRTSNVGSIVSGLQQYAADNSGVLPAAVTAATTATCIGTTSPCVDLTATLTPTYMATLPLDPGGPSPLVAGTAANTQYTVQYSTTTKRVTVAAPNAENNKTISATQ